MILYCLLALKYCGNASLERSRSRKLIVASMSPDTMSLDDPWPVTEHSNTDLEESDDNRKSIDGTVLRRKP